MLLSGYGGGTGASPQKYYWNLSNIGGSDLQAIAVVPEPTMYVANVGEQGSATLLKKVEAFASREGAPVVPVSAALEAQIAEMPDEDKKLFLEDMGMDEPGLNRVVRAAYRLLGLQTFFTAGPKEARAWTITRGTKAPQAAGVIHTDFERGFIKAETVAYDHLIHVMDAVKSAEIPDERDQMTRYALFTAVSIGDAP